MGVISATECSVPGCIVTLLRLVLPSSFSISHTSTDPVKTVGETISEVVEHVPSLVTELTSCLSLHHQGHTSRTDQNSPEGPNHEAGEGGSDADNSRGDSQNTGKTNTRRLFQDLCTVM
ncbi:hypothetical protein MERGE_000827 [Pneumocystis wakefieldiae]|uniref:Uncharacterized protein n=1 Tax=Pneumocystis wakefieldiae TaxID=38082 RepID=A0A899GCX1_9ASCO|nr:hypothetical protein MERGE_000827 [Pneumocystis wakefieldiae]